MVVAILGTNRPESAFGIIRKKLFRMVSRFVDMAATFFFTYALFILAGCVICHERIRAISP